MAMSRAERWALAPVALLLLDAEARVLDANDEFLRTIEVPDVEAVAGRRLADLLTVGGRIFWETHVGPRLHIEGRVDEVAVELRTPGGREPVLLTAIEREARGERLIEAPELFSLLPRELLDPILALGEEREYADGAAIMRRGAPGAELLLVLEGAIRIERPGFVMERGPGELVGEIEVLNPGEGRTADVLAVGPVRCLAVTRDALLVALEADPRAAVALVELLVKTDRAHIAAEHLRETLASAPENAPPEMLGRLVFRYATATAALGDPDGAHQLLHEAHHLSRRDLPITLALGESCFARKLWREAAIHLGSLADHPEEPA